MEDARRPALQDPRAPQLFVLTKAKLIAKERGRYIVTPKGIKELGKDGKNDVPVQTK